MITKIKRLKRYNLASKLSILRAFVDGITVIDDDVFMSIAYRKSRAFCRFDSGLNLKYRVEEKFLKKKGLGDFRCFTVDDYGNFIICGSPGDKNAEIVYLDKKGEIFKKLAIKDFPFIEAILTGADDSVFLHSPVSESPVGRFDPDGKKIDEIGVFPVKDGGIERKIALMTPDGHGGFYLVFEAAPVYVYRYDRDGNEIFHLQAGDSASSVDDAISVLDISTDKSGHLFMLRRFPGDKGREIAVFNPDGSEAESFRVPDNVRRICPFLKNYLYVSETIFGIGGMLVAGGIYGTITTLDVYKLTE